MTEKHELYRLLGDIKGCLSDDSCHIDKLRCSIKDFNLQLEKHLAHDEIGFLETRSGAHSKSFMIDLLPVIQTYFSKFKKGSAFEILDVGCGTGHGSNLLASLYQSMILGYRARVSAVDIDPNYHEYIKVFCPYIDHKIIDIYDINRSYDVVIASHVVEHVPDPIAFCRRLQQLSRGIVINCAPFKENPELLTQGHINIFDDEFINELDPIQVEYIENAGWGQFMNPKYKMFIAELKGAA